MPMSSSVFRVFIFILGVLLLITLGCTVSEMRGQSSQPEQLAAGYPPIAQPLVREGDFALDLAEVLKLGTVMDEAEAEMKLISVGISPRNGWISDYPVTPDIIGEVQASIVIAVASGKLTLGKDNAMAAFQEVINGYELSVIGGEGQPGELPVTDYPDSTVTEYYYDAEGPPAVTYYFPPPDYTYLYTWVYYPFWSQDCWFEGFFVLVDFNISVHGHEHPHKHGHERRHEGALISNHFHDPKTGKMARIDPTNRVRGGTLAETEATRGLGPSVQRGGQAILHMTESYRQSRGYGVTRPATRSSAFDRSSNNRIERAASDRGFQSRSTASQSSARGFTGGGSNHSGGGGGYHGGGGSSSGGHSK